MPGEESSRALAGRSAAADSADSFLHEAVDVWEPTGTDLLPPTGPKPGDLLSDRFIVEQRAGSGGMGVVHRGRDTVTSGLVAIKQPRQSSRRGRKPAAPLAIQAKREEACGVPARRVDLVGQRADQRLERDA